MKAQVQCLRKVLGVNLRLARVTAGLSQDDVSRLSSLHRTFIGSVERGKRNITIDNVDRLACALGYPASDLLRVDFMPKREANAFAPSEQYDRNLESIP